MKRRRVAMHLFVALLMSMGVLLVTTPALARWNVHNDADVTQMTAPVGATEDDTCASRLRGETGWSDFVEGNQDPSAYEPPAAAYTPTTYYVWKAPAGFTSFGEAQPEFDSTGNVTGFVFTAPDDTEHRATFVMQFKTAARTAVAQPIPIGEPSPDGGLYVFTTAPISQPLPDSIDPGDVIGILPSGASSALTLAVIACEPLTVSGTSIRAVKGTTFTATVARFTGPGGATDYSARIRWGDGTSSAGKIRSTDSGFVVKGTHRYRARGT